MAEEKNKVVSRSPSAKSAKKTVMVQDMNFMQALAAAAQGKKVSKREWPQGPKQEYFFISVDNKLKLHREGTDFDFIVCRQDIVGEHYFITQ